MRKNDDGAIRKELESHLEEHAAALVALGVEQAEARRKAALALRAEAAAEACRDVRPGQWREDLRRDLQHGLRLWRRQPGFTAVVLLTLGLGIGATTLMVTLVNGVLFKALAFAHPECVVSVQEQTAAPPNATAVAEGWWNRWAVTYPNYEDLRKASRTLELGAWTRSDGIASQPGRASHVDADEVTASLFPMLGVLPAAGRNFLPQEDQRGASPVAILSAGLARARFGSAQAAVGGRVVYEGQAYSVVGVMPPGFDLQGYTTADAADIYMPLGQDPSPNLQNRGRHILGVAARLRAGATLEQAQREVEVVARRLQAAYPQTNAQRSFLVRPWRADVGDTSTTLWLLLGAAGLVLLIGCANVASLLLVRAQAREPELAMRVALGAGRGRLIRQCLAESLLFGLGGGVLGLVLAWAGLRPFLAIWPGSLPRAADVSLDWRVLALAVVASLLCGIFFGLTPAWRTRLHAVDAVLRGGGRGAAIGGARLHSGFVIAEVGLAVVLLTGAGALGAAMIRLSHLDLGVNPQNVVVGRVAMPPEVLAAPARARAAWHDVTARVRAIPGVEAAATVDTVPLREGNNPAEYWVGAVAPPERQQPTALINSVGPEYFEVMRIPLIAGRYLGERDRMGAMPAAVIDDVLARHAFGGRNPIGQQIHIGLGNDPLTIVGVVQHVRYWGPAGDDANPVRDTVYYAFDQLPDRLVRRWSQLMSIAVRTSGPPGPQVAALTSAVRGPGDDEAFYEIRTLDQLARGSLDQQRFLLLLFAAFAVIALVLAALGIYGVQAFLAARRMPEFGVRVALGASRGRLLWLVVRQSLGIVLIGIGAGVMAALVASRILRSAVAGVGAVGVPTLTAVGLLLLLGAALASLPPARRASRVDPVRTLRQE